MIGEFLKIEDSMTRLGLFLENRFARGNSNFAEGFVTATLIYVIGSMGIIGAIESGVTGNHQTLFTKAVMDGFMSIMLTASLGIGVRYLPTELLDSLMNEISAIGGLMILAIGLNVMKLTKIRVSNYLPGILVLIAIMVVQYYYF